MKVLILDTKREWILQRLQKAHHDVDIFTDDKADNDNIDVILVHDSDVRKDYTLKSGETIQQMYEDIFKPKKEKKVIVYSGGKISDLTSTENLFIVNEIVPYNEAECPSTFSELLKTLDPTQLVSKYQLHSLRSQILTPFVALHLALQDSFDENGKVKDNPLIFDKECQKCCEDIKNQPLPDQFKDVKTAHSELKNKVGELCQIIEKGNVDDTERFKKLYEELCTAGKSGNGLIGDFAEMLEDVINKADFKKKIITLRHNIKNLLGTIDPNINALKNANKQAVREEWSIAKEAILRSGIDRVEKENKLYDEIRGTISKGNDIHEKLMEADKLYKVLFKAFSSNIEGDSIDSILKSGEAVIQILKDIIKKLEDIENA